MYDENVVKAAQLWHELYGRFPSREEYDSIEHSCAVVDGVPTEEQLRQYNSPLYSSSTPINVHGMKARVVRTADNPSLANYTPPSHCRPVVSDVYSFLFVQNIGFVQII